MVKQSAVRAMVTVIMSMRSRALFVGLARRLISPAALAELAADTGEEADLAALLAGTTSKILATILTLIMTGR